MAEEGQHPQPTNNQNHVVLNDGGKPNQVTLNPQQLGDIIMAEVDTVQLSQEHADIRREVAVGFGDTRYNIAERAGDVRREVAAGFDKSGDLVLGTSSDVRREAAEHTNEIVKEGLKGDYNTQVGIKDARFDINSRVAGLSREVDDRFFDTGRDLSDIRAQIISQQQATVAGFLGVSKDTEIAALKTQMDAAKNTAYLGDKIGSEGEKTRELINALNDQSLNRMLIERNAEIVEERGHARHWRGHYDNAQFAALTSQLNAFQSQLAETRQGMVNFGTMAGVGQTSTANNVR